MAALALTGAYTALVTPFLTDGSEVDWAAFERHVAAQLQGGISGLVPCGTTGETPTLSHAEQHEVIQRCVRLVKGRVPVIAGTGTNDTKATIGASRAALEAGADAVMIVMPYYNKPSQEGLVRHVELVAKAVSCPVILYNIPGRTAVELSVESTLRILDSSPNVIAIKDATGNIAYCQELLRRAEERVTVLSGDDPLTLALMSLGARGVISVTSNLYPRQVGAVVADILDGRWNEALRKHRALLPVHRGLFLEPNPQPVKAALALRGLMSPAVRPPLVEASSDCVEKLRAVIQAYEAS
ncbi:MAG TPA: 4-hydroxy-tetrahydrodipicolinate synthase [Polyangiaceae bacterium]